MIRKSVSTALFAAILVAASASPAAARPVDDEIGPTRVVCTVKLFWPISRQLCFEVPR